MRLTSKLMLVAAFSCCSMVTTLSAAPAYVTGNVNACAATSCAVNLTGTNAGDLIVLGLFVLNSTSVSSVVDTQGNTYTLIGGPQTWSSNNFVERLYYAKKIKGGADTVTVTLSGSIHMELYLYDYSGLDTSSPLDASATPTTGTGLSGTSGTVTTTNANDLLFGFFHSDNNVTNTAGSGFTGRSLSGNLLGEDRTAISIGSYSATMSFSGSADYVGFFVAFKAASGTPAAPGTPTYTNISTTSLTVNWTSSTGATSYNVYRSPSSSGTYSQMGTTSSTSFGDTGLTPNTTYWYKVAGTNANGTGSQSASSSVTTLSGGPVSYVTGNVNACAATSCAVNLTGTNAGDLIVLGLFVLNSTSVSSVIDMQGNQYTLIGSPQTWSPHNYVERLYYAKNIKGGANTTTVTLSGSAYMEMRLYDYSGLDTSSPLDASATPQTGTSVTGTSGTLTTSNANDLLFGYFHSDNDVTNSAGSGFTGRILGDDPEGEDRVVTSTGSYSATMSFSGSADYVGFLVAFKAAAGGGGSLSISGVSVSPTATTAAVSWTTNVSASSRVDYGLTAAYGSNVTDPTLVTSHSLTLTSLTCNTTYHYQITSVSSAGSASTADSTFTTGACPISISGISVTTTATSATVMWTTNVSASSRVDYGLTPTYGTNVSDSTLVTSHSLMLNSLTCSTAYHYQITSVSSVGSASTADATFTIGACGGPVSDDFHSLVLNPMWTFYAHCCGYVKMTGTDALLVVPSVTAHDIYNVNYGVGLLQAVANVDFQVEVKFDSVVTQGDQTEGILVQQDAQNFIWFAVYHDGTTPRIWSPVTIGGTPSQQYNNPITIPPGTTSFWMRVKRSGTTWTQSWSTDGTNYNTNTVSQALVVSAIGPFGGNDNDPRNDPAPSFTAAVDYFFNTASPISPTDGGLQPPNQPVFNVWYGDNQTFGQNGIPQRWVNILGNVSAPSGIASASYTLNGGASQFLRVGPNGYRLADTGDFNVEIDHASLNSGPNTVVITATDNLSNTTTHTVTVNWANTGQVWPLPYSIDWSTVTNISDVAQVVDGQWAIQPDGTIRTIQTGYDRVIAFGDETWTDYQVTAEMTFNSVDCFDFGAGVLVGWTGHTYDSTNPAVLQPDQPRTGHPYFGLGEYGSSGTGTDLNIGANSPNFPEATLIEDTSVKLVLGVKYVLKFAVQRNPNNTSSHFSLKVWPASTAEPASWNLQADGDASTGSAMLATFRSDVSFGKITVVALP